jgi:hypothetical protein
MSCYPSQQLLRVHEEQLDGAAAGAVRQVLSEAPSAICVEYARSTLWRALDLLRPSLLAAMPLCLDSQATASSRHTRIRSARRHPSKSPPCGST